MYGNNAYGFNSETGEAKSSDIQADRTTRDERDSDEEWNPDEETWKQFMARTQ